jgi:hypothetical protein
MPIIEGILKFCANAGKYLMPNKPNPKRPRDANQLARSIVELATGQAEEKAVLESARKRGLKGGKARAKALTQEQRSEIASIAARARWNKTD